MISRTPAFDAALDAIFATLVPHERVCAECNGIFKISEEDISLLQKLRVPPGKLCFDCGRQRRLAFLNYTSLYKRSCDAPEHSEEMVSSIPPGVSFPIYDYNYWQSYAWEPSVYAEVPASGSLFDQFLRFHAKIPTAALTRHPGSVGSDYTLYGYNFKNCYLTFGGATSENTHYSNWAKDCKDSMDLLMTSDAELSTNAVSARGLYKSHYVYFSYDTIESDFLYDCRNVSNSYCCVNLRNKKYCWFNEQLTKEEYERRRSEIDLGDREVLRREKEKFRSFLRTQPIRAIRNEKSENVVGNYITNSKNCFNVIRGIECENIRYGDYIVRVRDGMNMAVSANGELLYETSSVTANSSNVKFSYNGRILIDCEFTANCRNSKNLFMCVGLENKQYCIFNKQYAEDEYYAVVDMLKVRMLASGEYGDFFPATASPYAYNGSLAHIVYPLKVDDARARGFFWHDEGEQRLAGITVLPISDLPKNIKDTGDDIVNAALKGVDGKAFRIIPAEMQMYRSQNLSIPDTDPYNRMIDRFAEMNNLRLADDLCRKCGKAIKSGYDPAQDYRVYCEQCYQSEVV